MRGGGSLGLGNLLVHGQVMEAIRVAASRGEMRELMGSVSLRDETLLTSKEVGPLIGVKHHKTVERSRQGKGASLRARGTKPKVPPWRRPPMGGSAKGRLRCQSCPGGCSSGRVEGITRDDGWTEGTVGSRLEPTSMKRVGNFAKRTGGMCQWSR